MKNNHPKSVIILSVFLMLFVTNSFAQTTWPCAQYITRQVPNGSAYMTNISYVYNLGVVPVTVTVAKTDTLLNASAIYNGNIWAWKQYTGTAQSGSAGARLIKVNYNGLDSTIKPTLTGYSFPSITMGCNAAFVDPNGIYYVINTATSGATNFILSRINLATATPTLLTNLTVNLPSGSTVSSGGLGDLVYRHDSVFALVNNVGLFRFALPSLSTTTVSPNLVGSAINRTIGSLFSINSDANNIYGYGSANGATTQDRLIKISTQTGAVTELTTSGVSVSQSDGAGCPSTDFSKPLVFLNISGKVFDDANGLKGTPANTIDGTGTNAGGALYAQLLDGTNTVEATIPVGSDGTYTFTGLTPGNYTVLINNSSIASTSTTLPSNWVNTGEYNALIAGSAGSDGNINGKSATVTLVLANVANVNFGVEQLPTANNITASSQQNPGGTIKVTVPTLNGSDPEQGTLAGTGNLDTVIINTLPVNGTLYYNNVAVNAGDTIKNYNPSLLTLDPNSGAIIVSFTYSEVDAALRSGNIATVNIPFTMVPISGNVYDDGNGLQDGTINGIGTNAGGTLYAQLLDSTNKVVSTVAVASDGSYVFPANLPGTYTVVLDTSSTAKSTVALPSGYYNTGENFGAGAGSDGIPNGILKSILISTTNYTNINFGINQPPVANAVIAASQVNPGGNNKVVVPTLNGSDPEQGILPGTGNLDTVIINTLPTNGILYYNNVAVAAGDTIKNYNPSLLTIDPNTGAVTTSFTYSEVDAALKSSTPATVTLSFTQISISGNVYDDANGLTDNTVNGIGTNAGGLNVLLLDSATNKVIATTVAAVDGSYNFAATDGGSIIIEITTLTATAGSTAPTITLPDGWASTGENIGTAAGNDGAVNSLLPLGVVFTTITNANFGVEQLPLSNNETYNIMSPIINSSITLDGSLATTPGPLAGSDPEDGILGAANTVIITTIPTNSLLYYNGNVVTDSTIINNYDPSKLQVKFNTPGILNTSFQYEFVDAAGNHSVAPATYLISWATVLPVVLSSFKAEKENESAVLSWTTSSEINVKVFNVERSTDNGATWQPVGEVAAVGHSSSNHNYSFTDDNPKSGTNLYRLQIEDNNGSITYSSIATIDIQNESAMNVYPNPVGEDQALNIQLTGLKSGEYHIRLISASGQTVKNMTFTITNTGSALLVIPTGTLTRGSYVVIVNGNNLQYTKTVVVANR